MYISAEKEVLSNEASILSQNSLFGGMSRIKDGINSGSSVGGSSVGFPFDVTMLSKVPANDGHDKVVSIAKGRGIQKV